MTGYTQMLAVDLTGGKYEEFSNVHSVDMDKVGVGVLIIKTKGPDDEFYETHSFAPGQWLRTYAWMSPNE